MDINSPSIPAAPGPRFDLPTIEDESRGFWDAARQGKLMVGSCRACARLHYYPRPMCPHCWSEDTALTEVSGHGVIYTWSTVFMNDLPPFKERLPYVAAQVDLAEGLRITTNLVDCDPDQLSIGQAVSVVFTAISDTVTIPVFKPV